MLNSCLSPMKIRSLIRTSSLAWGIASILMVANTASATSFNFTDITGVSSANNAADQIHVDVISGGSGTVRFNFTFDAGDAGIVTAIGFGGSNSGFLTGSPTLFNGSGVSFIAGSPPNLGGGGFTQIYGVERTNAGGVSNGMSNGETLGVQYSLYSGKVLADIIDSINSGTFKIGLHIQSLDNGGSQKAVLTGNPPPQVPDAGMTAILLGLGLVSLAVFRRKAA
jgi:hypothetical protein